MIKLSLAIQTPEVEPLLPVALLSGTFEEKLQKAAGCGAEGVELMSTNPSQLDAEKIRRQLKQHGLEAAAVSSGGMAAAGLTLLHADPLRASQARSRLNLLIEFAARVGAPLVTVGGFRGRLASLPGGQGEEILAQILNQAADLGARQGVRLVIEPLNRYETDFIRTAEQGLALISRLGNPSLGLLLDTFHVNIEERSWTEPFERALAAGKLWHVHLGDNNRLPPGCGLIDFRAIAAVLSARGYHGFLSAELLAQPDPDQAARLTIQYMKGLSYAA